MPQPSIPPRIRLLDKLDEQPIYSVYRIYDGRKLLYVGMSANVKQRITQHLRTKAWANLVTHIDVEGGYTKTEALGKEAGQIIHHTPTYNEVHNAPSKRRSAAVAERLAQERRNMDAGAAEKLQRLALGGAAAAVQHNKAYNAPSDLSEEPDKVNDGYPDVPPASKPRLGRVTTLEEARRISAAVQRRRTKQ